MKQTNKSHENDAVKRQEAFDIKEILCMYHYDKAFESILLNRIHIFCFELYEYTLVLLPHWMSLPARFL